MTQFEIIMLAVIYMICYGFTLTMMFTKENNVWLKSLWVVVSLAIALYAPLMIGGMLYEKLKDK